MAKTLIIVEAPAKARHIQEFLGSSYVVKASIGHVRELPIPKNMSKEEKERYGDYAQDLAHDFEPLYKVSAGKKKVMADLRRALKDADELILATDPDAEGHAIAWHLLQELKPKVPASRATWTEITKGAVETGLKNRERIDLKKREPAEFFGQAESALTRAQWDRLYGYATSPYLWKALKPGTSSGRVQTPGAKLVVEREEKRLAFKSVSYYSIWGEFEGQNARLVEFAGEKIADGSKIDDEGNLKKGYVLITDENLSGILSELKKKSYEVGEVTSKPYRRTPPPPFTTSSALQSIGGRTRLSAKQLTAYFQELYATDAAVTYIRTVSVVAAPEAITEARAEIKRLFGAQLLPAKARVYKDKKAGNSGHECLRPVLEDSTGKLAKRTFSDKRKQNVFDAIRLRFLASQSIDCEGTTWSATFVAKDKGAKFSASETEIHEPGWTKIYGADEE